MFGGASLCRELLSQHTVDEKEFNKIFKDMADEHKRLQPTQHTSQGVSRKRPRATSIASSAATGTAAKASKGSMSLRTNLMRTLY